MPKPKAEPKAAPREPSLTRDEVMYLRRVWYQTPELYWLTLDEVTGNSDRSLRPQFSSLVWEGTEQHSAFHAAGGRRAVPVPERKQK